MPNSGPPWVQTILVAVTVENVPVVPAPATEVAAGGVGRYSGSDTTYQDIVSWTVTAARTGQLIEISFTSSILAKTHWKVLIGSSVFCVDKLQDAPLAVPFHDLKLAAGAVVKVQCKSTDGTGINADACIVAKEIF